ncbi:MAG: hypothetical protein L0287_05395 [Anaerolineae bacterium]|nr:hypothetical protein [Anaerolineae bacterium]
MLFKNRKLSVLNFVLIFVLIIGIHGSAQAASATLIIPYNYPTIQAAIYVASPSDTIVVRSETYFENLTLNDMMKVV